MHTVSVPGIGWEVRLALKEGPLTELPDEVI